MPFPPPEAITAFPKLVPIDMESTRGLGSFALYTLVPISDMPSFLTAVNTDSDLEEDYVVLPPRHDFSGRTLADIMEYHLAHTRDAKNREDFDYGNFMVAIHEDVRKHGVLVVTVIYENFSDTEAVPMLARCPVASFEGHEEPEDDLITALSWLCNLQIGNMDMYDLLESSDAMPWPTELPGYKDLRAQLDQACVDVKQRAYDHYGQLHRRTERYVVHHFLKRDTGTQKDDVETDGYYKEECGREDRVATTHGIHWSAPPMKPVEELWEQVRREHPGRCKDRFPRREPFWGVNKYWMFVYDTEPEDGNVEVALVKLRWDGVTEGKSKEELEGIMPDVEIVERCGVREALERMDSLAGIS